MGGVAADTATKESGSATVGVVGEQRCRSVRPMCDVRSPLAAHPRSRPTISLMPFVTEEKAGLHYVDHGGAGEPILLIHGLGGSHVNWDAVAPGLSALGHVVAIDLPGFGTNEPDEHQPEVSVFAERVAEFVSEHFGRPATLIGNSMGGLVSMLTAIRFPEQVTSLVLASPALPPRSIRFHWVTAQLLIRTAPGLGELITKQAYDRYSMEELTDLAYANLCADPSVVPEDMWHRSVVLANWRKEKRWATYAFSTASASILRELTPARYRRHLESVTVPTLLIHGDHDQVVQPASAVWAAGVRPDWRFEMLRGVGHLPMIERPSEFVGLVADFMSKSRSSSPAQSPRA